MSNDTQPEIRFPGFTDDWELRKSKELCTISTGKGNTQDKVDDGAYPFYVRSATIEKSDEYLYDQEAVLTVGDGVGTGKVYHYVNGKYNLHQRVYRMYDFKDVSAKYFYYYFSNNFYKRVMSMTAKTSVDSVRMEMIADMNIVFPSVKEQENIVELFSNLDNTIALHQRKLDLLKETKKGFLQKMFPKNGAKVPEIRFPGFTEDWEQRKFFDNIKNTIDFRGRTPKKLGMDWSVSGYLALSALNVKNGYIDPSVDAHYGNQELYDKWMSGKELYKGQVLFTTEAPMGNVAQVPDNNKYILSQRTIAFELYSDKITDDFLAVLLRSPQSYNKLLSLASGGTAKGVSQKSLSQFIVTLPKDLDEQQKIGSFFKQLDDTIALHQRKLDLLKEMKKGFLQKMFV
ncbi:type I restriction enzyme, S subunit [Enterococcus sp. DIV1248a]|uniref:restriction endonuclease subunit S n=1 Tax=Enterococcus TaxID=1350 RepID=UPI001A036ACA|nr:restriction endonuclease subunit S [Enterococcus faecium]